MTNGTEREHGDATEMGVSDWRTTNCTLCGSAVDVRTRWADLRTEVGAIRKAMRREYRPPARVAAGELALGACSVFLDAVVGQDVVLMERAMDAAAEALRAAAMPVNEMLRPVCENEVRT